MGLFAAIAERYADIGTRVALRRGFGPVTLRPEDLDVPAGHLVVDGELVAIPGVDVRTWVDHPVKRFGGTHRLARNVTELVIHESVTRSAMDAERVLRRRGLGVHVIVAADGVVTQHADLATTRLTHAGGHNGPSVGVEVINPYYPRLLRRSLPWTETIDAPWAHKGRYVLPTRAQAEAVCQLIAALSGPESPLPVERNWIGLRGDRLRMGALRDGQTRRSGIWAHHYSNHADGCWPVLYAYLRLEAGLSPVRAYDEAVRLATGARGWVDLSGVAQ